MLRRKIIQFCVNPTWAKVFGQSLRSTFSQYGEDQVFKLLFQPGIVGTYVDVGSHHPAKGSNTFYLYNRGWRGVTIDPNPVFAEGYRKLRPDEPHLVEGVSPDGGELTYFEFADSVFNTLSADRADELQRMGKTFIGTQQVPCRSLEAIVDECLADRQIDLLSVDCEGFDRMVIESLNLQRHRPTVMIVEDYDRLRSFRDGAGQSELHDFLSDEGYCPVAQLAFSSIYVSRNCRELMARSSAYDISRIQGGILP